LPFFIHRKEVWALIKSLWANMRQVDDREPEKIRNQVILLIFFALLWLALSVIGSGGALGGKWTIFFLYFEITAIIWMGLVLARVNAEIGQPMGAWNGMSFGHTVNNIYGWWFLAMPHSPFYIADENARLVATAMSSSYSFYGFKFVTQANPGPYILEAYKIADLTGTSKKYVFRAILLAVPVAIISSLISWLTWSYAMGHDTHFTLHNLRGWPSNWCVRSSAYIKTMGPEDAVSRALSPVGPQVHIGFALGVLFVIILYIIRWKFPAFPLVPSGLALAFGLVNPGLIFPAIIAYIAKTIVIRVGGAKLYTEKALPFAIGLILGLNLILLISTLYLAATTL